ncbi:hypothetical protein BDQ17DRAFT_1329248 [Cyathus striatus]|nr:hypothetical protein BDQ17DRAFT_1329248 [Cyathus striatus]
MGTEDLHAGITHRFLAIQNPGREYAWGNGGAEGIRQGLLPLSFPTPSARFDPLALSTKEEPVLRNLTHIYHRINLPSLSQSSLCSLSFNEDTIFEPRIMRLHVIGDVNEFSTNDMPSSTPAQDMSTGSMSSSTGAHRRLTISTTMTPASINDKKYYIREDTKASQDPANATLKVEASGSTAASEAGVRVQTTWALR